MKAYLEVVKVEVADVITASGCPQDFGKVCDFPELGINN